MRSLAGAAAGCGLFGLDALRMKTGWRGGLYGRAAVYSAGRRRTVGLALYPAGRSIGSLGM